MPVTVPDSRNVEAHPLLDEPDSVHESANLPTPICDHASIHGTPKSWISKYALVDHLEAIGPRYRFLPMYGCLIVFGNAVEFFMREIGFYRAIEALYCIEYYERVDENVAALYRHIPESMCKKRIIQKHVATDHAQSIAIDMVCAIVGIAVLGTIADRFGRRVALIIHKVAITIYCICLIISYYGYPTLPIKTSCWINAVSLFGASYDMSLAFILADYTLTLTSPVQRATCFLATTCMWYVAQLISQPIAGLVINMDGNGTTPELAYVGALAGAVLSLVVTILCWPDTRKDPKIYDAPKSSSGTDSAWRDFKSIVRSIGHINVAALALSICLSTAATKSIDWISLLQYPIIKFGWNFSQSAYAMTGQAFIYCLVYFVFLPSAQRSSLRRGQSDGQAAFRSMLISVLFLLVGAISLGLSVNPAQFIAAMCIYTLGAGLPTLTHTYIANLRAHARALGNLLSFITYFQVVGKIMAVTLGPWLINKGIDTDNRHLTGVVFFVAAGAVCLAAAMLVLVRVEPGLPKSSRERRDSILDQVPAE